jgi:prevent-host-death family protein
MSVWQLQEAKARLSEVVEKAATEGPQKITVHGEPAAVLISCEEYQRLKHPKGIRPIHAKITPERVGA